ncbi:MAG TPA: hypothetical protein VHV47_04795, partial [Opitutaceae bacterium]|nr:hypothetical protein [Opitutaceae bacterium]
YLPENVAAAAFAWGSALLACLLLRRLRSAHFPGTPSWVMGLGLTVVTFGNLLPLLLRRPVFYELAIASACFFALLAALWLHRALGRPERATRYLAGASLALGLAVAARPDYLFGTAALWGVYLWWIRPSGRPPWAADRRRFLAALLAIVIPLGAIGLAMAVYNDLRFGSWTEFGTHYMLAGSNQEQLQMTGLKFAPLNFYYYFLAPPQISAYFPFFQVIAFPPLQAPAGFQGEEDVYGALFSVPVIWGLLCLRGALHRRTPAASDQLKLFSAATLACAGMVAAFLLTLCGATNRYLVDFLTPALPLAVAGIMAWEARPPGGLRLLGRIAWVAALGYTLLFNFFSSLEHNGLFRHFQPGKYRQLAHAFNHLSLWDGETSASRVGPLEIRLIFPADRTGHIEPLIVTGLSFQADFLWVFYTDANHLQLGFEHTSYGGPKTDPIEIDYSVAHTLRVEMGSFYPPVDHPYFDGVAPEAVARLKRTLRVSLDGREVLAATCDFYDSSPGDVTVGHNPVSDAFGRRFGGRILGTRRGSAPAAP